MDGSEIAIAAIAAVPGGIAAWTAHAGKREARKTRKKFNKIWARLEKRLARLEAKMEIQRQAEKKI